MASNNFILNSWLSKRIIGDNSSANPTDALLQSGSAGRGNTSPNGDTWLFLDSQGGTSSPFGIKHNQANDDISFYGSGTLSTRISLLNNGNNYISGNLGIGTEPTHKLHVNGSTYIAGPTVLGIASVGSNNRTTINGKLVVNPSYDTESNSFNEGIRVNQASNGWAEVHLGGAVGSVSGNSDGAWLIGRRGEAGSYAGAIGDLTFEEQNYNGAGLTLHKDLGGMTLYTDKTTNASPFTLKNMLSFSSGFSWMMNGLLPNMAAGANAIYLIGAANGAYNQSYLGFHYTGPGSTSNYLTLGLYAADHLVRIYGTGNVAIGADNNNYKLYVNGTGYFTGSLNLTSTTPLVFLGNGSGTYNRSVLYVDSTGVNLETPRTTDSSSANVLPFRIGTRGGQLAPVYASVFNGSLNGNASTATKARYVEGDNDAANPGGALLRSGSGRQDASPSGDTWIYWDTLGGTSSYWGIRHDQGTNTISFCGAGGVGAYITLNTGNSKFGTISSDAITSSSSVTCNQILMPATVTSAATSQPTALSYGRLQAWGTLCINADTDGSGAEYVILTAGHGCSSSISDGFYVGTSEAGSYLSTRIRNTLHIHGSGGNWTEGIRIHAAPNGWATFILCGTDNTGDSGTSANSYSMHAYDGNFYLTRNGSSSGSSIFSCLTDNYWRVSTRLYNAVWNDFAEYRCGETTEGGRAVYDDNTGIMKITTERMQPASRLVSDTYGFAVGESDDAHTPIGIGGRVLAFPYQDRNNYKVGDAVCAAPNGTVDIMTREEIREYPDRIIGIVSEIPNYEVWENKLTGSSEAKVSVNGRIWVYIK